MIAKPLVLAFFMALGLVSSTAHAAIGISCSAPAGPDGICRSSEVSTVVTENVLDGTWTYNYTVFNTSPGPQFFSDGEVTREVWPLIVDYEVPLDDPGVVSGIQSPTDWSHEFLSATEYLARYGEANPFGSAWVLHWFDALFSEAATAIAPTGYRARFCPGGGDCGVYENFTDGFIFTSSLAPVNGPYSTSWADEMRNIGDPPLPGGVVGGGLTLPFQVRGVMEPSALLLLGAGLVALALARRRYA